MSKRLRIVVPTIQVLAVVATVAWSNLTHDAQILVNVFGPTRDLLLKENFPLVVMWAPLLYGVDWAGGVLGPIGSVGRALGTIAFGLLLFVSVFLFWYLVVIETEMRMRGESLLRFRDSLAEAATLAFLFLMGSGAFLYAYTSTAMLLRLRKSTIDAGVGALFLVIWGLVFIGIVVVDLRRFFRRSYDPRRRA